MTESGKISQYLEEDIATTLRQRGIVVWLDKDAHYNDFVDQLKEMFKNNQFFAPVVAYRGSYLEMLLELEPYANGLDPEPLLIHLPNATEETVKETPILELYKAGYRYRKKLETLVRESVSGLVEPKELDKFLEADNLSLELAEKWLDGMRSKIKGGFTEYFESLSIEWVIDSLIRKDFQFSKQLSENPTELTEVELLNNCLYRRFGLTNEFLRFYYDQEIKPLNLDDLVEGFIAWILCIEFVNDLTREPNLPELKALKNLAPSLRKVCDQAIYYFRDKYSEEYASFALLTEGRLEEEFRSFAASELGKIDTFNFEEEKVLKTAILSLKEDINNSKEISEWSEPRLKNYSFWLKREPNKRFIWELIYYAINLKIQLENHQNIPNNPYSINQLVEYYSEQAYKVDLAHRQFEQKKFDLLSSKLPYFSELLEIANNLSIKYRQWVDNLAIIFNNACEKYGTLPESNLQQRFLFGQEILPLIRNNDKVAVFLIDAFRYEMAAELFSEIEQETGIKVNLSARLAELPSITAVGMNALAPVQQNGRLILAKNNDFNGFKAGEYSVRTPDDRVRAMGDASVDNVSKGRRNTRYLKLAEACSKTTDSLKKSIAGVNLIIVHSKEIDDAGEANLGIGTFITWLSQIKAAWNHLKSIGVQEFIFTADHGFLLQDQNTKVVTYGNKRDPSRRYVFSQEYRAEKDCLVVSLDSLKYEGGEGYLIFRKDTAVFATANSDATFVHGGNSLQERVIPVLYISLTYTQKNKGKGQKYQIKAQKCPNLLGFERIKLNLEDLSGTLAFIRQEKIALALRVTERPDINISIKQVEGAELKNQQIYCSVEDREIEILFTLEGTQDEKVELEVYHPDSVKAIDPVKIANLFQVAGILGGRVKESVPKSEQWYQYFKDEKVLQVFIHIEKYSSITEAELVNILGSARNVRRFSSNFEEYSANVPFDLRIETSSSGKRYVKEK